MLLDGRNGAFRCIVCRNRYDRGGPASGKRDSFCAGCIYEWSLHAVMKIGEYVTDHTGLSRERFCEMLHSRARVPTTSSGTTA